MQSPSAFSMMAHPRAVLRLGMAVVIVLTMVFAAHEIIFPALKRRALWAVINACAAIDVVAGRPWPCLVVTRTPAGRDIVVLSAPSEPGHILVVPAQRIDGLESPELGGDLGSDYLEASWRLRDMATAPFGARGEWSDFGLAINGPWHRTQKQLHVHVECLRPAAEPMFVAMKTIPVGSWVALDGDRRTFVRRWPHSDLRGVDFRRDLYEAMPIAPDRDILRINLGAIGIIGPAGEREFLLLYSTGRTLERFLDPDCMIARTPR